MAHKKTPKAEIENSPTKKSKSDETALLQEPPKEQVAVETKKQEASSSTTKKTDKKATIVVHYDAGYGNMLSIRGSGAGLNWTHGTPLKNIKADQWVWEAESNFEHVEYKILLNDYLYEQGSNHQLQKGAIQEITPTF